jgi:hypothetical protein
MTARESLPGRLLVDIRDGCAGRVTSTPPLVRRSGADPDVTALIGLWRRGLLRRPGAVDDRTTVVWWLQGPHHYVDLRQPSSPAAGHRSEGFAGVLQVRGGVAVWQRDVDLMPPTGLPDSGRLTLTPHTDADGVGAKDLLVEDGVHEPYVEHWWREPSAAGPSADAAGRDLRTGAVVVAVRVGPWFGLARGGEISLGRVGELGWHIERSSLTTQVGRYVALPSPHDVRFDVVHGDETLLRQTDPGSSDPSRGD